MSSITSPSTLLPDSTSPPASPMVPQPATKKRKRKSIALEEIEVDIDAPEPPSKKTLRKSKKVKRNVTGLAPQLIANDATSNSDGTVAAQNSTSALRSEYGIWIGNLPWVASKADLRRLLTSNADVEDESITRIHMPVPAQPPIEAARQNIKPQNKGFAYVDFSKESTMIAALTLSETLLSGRRVLIKDAKSFEGRPDPLKEKNEGLGLQVDRPPSKRVFVGNLAFDTTREELKENFAKCGQVADCFVATFEDTGKCKGYAWITFEELEAATKAVQGWVGMSEKELASGDEDEEDLEDCRANATAQKKSKKIRKWWVNRIKGRPLRMEFAEDKAFRYKKRFGKAATRAKGDDDDENEISPFLGTRDANVNTLDPSEGKLALDGEGNARSKARRGTGEQVDARTIKPGAPLARAQRLTGAILPSQGKKIVFE